MEATQSSSKAKQSKYEYEYANREEPLTTAVIEALARVENVDPTALGVNLYDAVDPDLIDALGQSIATASRGDSDWWYQFTIDSYTVEISSDGTISVHTNL